ncbi:MAG: hypothetical protein BWY88_00204 [Synergistetes bacterium ADurb.Bin520]|nr:MAG: hypothetical protein BWY88_00204 [Synergistetes bacterium ADurb.Bin520]
MGTSFGGAPPGAIGLPFRAEIARGTRAEEAMKGLGSALPREPGLYSCRRASMGSSREAFHAG